MNKQELASRIWMIADDLRGSMEASEYKDYIMITANEIYQG
ncbi:TPA: type I restriction-modification system subunit M N-terminal domain-containing protein [Staphylococcus aureus]|nr:type I restriction-modification system subunit M N-terminal domain-containing protein [Staphylococcus aureus]MCD2456193.1 type I restriction-modification system subunit M N-terminal domain-containing protein [Staphylococcus aureus]MCD2473447.1 type I restriction-modification system subunit M N-terminal domain-containing protein [Staphylococcus aureus]MCD2485669.1 type I restriction-modification system subunit M N-terminal domain-containing protein [Staphylococcus aureus]MCD2495749.1 type I r